MVWGHEYSLMSAKIDPKNTTNEIVTTLLRQFANYKLKGARNELVCQVRIIICVRGAFSQRSCISTKV